MIIVNPIEQNECKKRKMIDNSTRERIIKYRVKVRPKQQNNVDDDDDDKSN